MNRYFLFFSNRIMRYKVELKGNLARHSEDICLVDGLSSLLISYEGVYDVEVQEVTRRLNNGSTLTELAEELAVCENQLKNALRGLGYICINGHWTFRGNVGFLFNNKNKEIFEFVSKKEEVNFTSEQILMLKQVADYYIEEKQIQKLKTEISNEINKLPIEQGIREKIMINKGISERLNAFLDKLELRKSDIISLALSDFFSKYEVDKVK
ncbi:hypothetical protein [Bacillus sp. XF8]|uniref:Uncharacterized protein n=1 Tax=Bacillus bingmayongensis TaxID=1150157 RepID=A0ABU5K1I3_9BACI|nr:hypothetical protein [Bacillus sp. XF8]MBO1582969.1 hypothetical protein [Bacillus sp. XF8]MDZ5609486.1 hypothetical protein [Bacillus pseudomycoides]